MKITSDEPTNASFITTLRKMNDNLEQDDYSKNQPSAGQWILIAVIGFLALAGIIIFLASGYFGVSAFLENRGLHTTETATVATAVVRQRLQVVETASQWPIEIFETFENNDNEWIEGEINDEYATMRLSIAGDYTWKISSKQGFIWWTYPLSNPMNDFYMAVDAKNSSSNRQAAYGLVFHLNENDYAYHYFSVRDTQLFSVWAKIQDEWTELIPNTTSMAIRPGEVNHLEVIARDDMYYFLINDDLVAETPIQFSDQGYAGVAVELSYEDEQSTIIFDNFELRAP